MFPATIQWLSIAVHIVHLFPSRLHSAELFLFPADQIARLKILLFKYDFTRQLVAFANN